MIYNNPRTLRCTKPGCDCQGRDPLRSHCKKHPQGKLQVLIQGFSLHVRCLHCEECIGHYRLMDPGHNEPNFEIDEPCSACGGS